MSGRKVINSKQALRIGLAALAVAAFVAALLTLPVSEWLVAIVDWTQGAGWLGVLVFSVAYVTATVLMLPGSILTLGAGFVYGPLWGTLLVSPVSVMAAGIAFVLGRSVARQWIARRMERNPRFKAIDEAIGEGGFKIVLLLRLSPVFPFNLLNYSLGLTRVSLRDYLLASFIGMLPGTFLYVYLGSLVTNASQLLSGKRPSAGPWQYALYGAGLVATLLVTLLITRMARQALQRHLDLKPESIASQPRKATS
jgi:uncharacterized membrane protein YdjX (TVP38/TMEM64 family)